MSIAFGIFCIAIAIGTWRYLYLFLIAPVDFDRINNPPDGKRGWVAAFLMYGAWIGVAYMIFASFVLGIELLPASLTRHGDARVGAFILAVIASLVVSARSLFRLAAHGHTLANLEQQRRDSARDSVV